MSQEHLAVIPLCWTWDDEHSATWWLLAEAAGKDGHTGDAEAEVHHGQHPLVLWWLRERRDRFMHEQRVRG